MTDPEHLPLVRIEPLGATFDAPDSLTLLEAAAFAHVSLPRSCRNGTCRSCLCRIVSGSVRYTIEWPASREEKPTAIRCRAWPSRRRTSCSTCPTRSCSTRRGVRSRMPSCKG